MKDIKTLEQFKREFKHTGKDKIIEMFYNQGLIIIELIEILKQNNKKDKCSVQRYEKMRRNCEDEFYKKSYQTSIHKLNAKREVRKNILELLDAENEESY